MPPVMAICDALFGSWGTLLMPADAACRLGPPRRQPLVPNSEFTPAQMPSISSRGGPIAEPSTPATAACYGPNLKFTPKRTTPKLLTALVSPNPRYSTRTDIVSVHLLSTPSP